MTAFSKFGLRVVVRSLGLLLVGAIIVVAIGAVLWFTVSPFRPVPNEKPQLASAVYVAARAAGEGGTLDMRALTDFEWDRVYTFEAYTSDDEVSETLGFPWGSGQTFRMPNDGFLLLIFAKEQQVTGWVVLNDYESPGPYVQFEDAPFKTPIPRDAAVFRLAVSP